MSISSLLMNITPFALLGQTLSHVLSHSLFSFTDPIETKILIYLYTIVPISLLSAAFGALYALGYQGRKERLFAKEDNRYSSNTPMAPL